MPSYSPTLSPESEHDARLSIPGLLNSLVRDWYYSLGMLIVYVLTFVAWKYFPSRQAFIYGGLVSAAVMGLGMAWAAKRKYFVGRVDWAVHAYVIVDILLEGIMYEALRSLIDVSHVRDGFVYQFHDNNNFFFCALTFAVLIGGNRWAALRRAQRTEFAEAVGPPEG